MFTAKQYRDKASQYAEHRKTSNGSKEADKFARLEKSFTGLADNEEWLSKNYQKTVHADAVDAPEAAVIMQWNTIPTKLQRELFDTAGSMGDVLKSVELRGQIARFLHKHKDEESSADRDSKPDLMK